MKSKKVIKKGKGKNFFLILVIFAIFNYFFIPHSFSNVSDSKKTSISISQNSYERVIGYLDGNFFSYSENKKITKALGMYLALSEDGESSAISYCQDFLMTCNKNLVKIRTKMLCERISNSKCIVLFNEDIYLPSKERIKKKKYQILNKYFLIFKSNEEINKNKHQEIRISNSSETSDGSKWDM